MEENFDGRKRKISADTLEQRLGAMTVVSAVFSQLGNALLFPGCRFSLNTVTAVFPQSFAQKAGAHGAVLGMQLLLLHPFPS